MKWLEHVKQYRKMHGGSYKDAMKNAKASYQGGHIVSSDDESSSDESSSDDSQSFGTAKESGVLKNVIRRRRGGAVGNIELLPSNIPSFGNTNLGVMRVPQSKSRYRVVNGPIFNNPNLNKSMRGGGVIDELGNQGYLGQLYDQKNLGANGVVKL
jgi:hypothetical protein